MLRHYQFLQAEGKGPDARLPSFYQGLTLNKVERYDQTPARFSRASLKDPEFTAFANHQSDIAHYRANFQDEAEDAFKSVIDAEANAPLGQSSHKLLELVKTCVPTGQTKEQAVMTFLPALMPPERRVRASKATVR